MRRPVFRAALAATVLTLAMSATALAQEGPRRHTADLSGLNDSGASGSATVTIDGGSVSVEIQASGLTPGAPHAQHIHVGGQNTCPGSDADTDGDGLITTPEGQPAYGEIMISLTTEGGVGADSGLAVERFPTADDGGALSYSRTFELPSGVSADDLAGGVIVQHGVDLNDSGTYDGERMSDLDPNLPLEATIPATCGALTAASGDGGSGSDGGEDPAGAGDGTAQPTTPPTDTETGAVAPAWPTVLLLIGGMLVVGTLAVFHAVGIRSSRR